MAEDDQKTADASASGEPSPRAPYRALLKRLHESGDLGASGLEHRMSDIAEAETWGDLEAAIAGLSRDEVPVPTRRKQRRELPPDDLDETDEVDQTDEVEEADEVEETTAVEDSDSDEDDDSDDEADDDDADDDEADSDEDDADSEQDDDDLDDDDLDDDEDDDLDDEEDDEPSSKSRSGKAGADKSSGRTRRAGTSPSAKPKKQANKKPAKPDTTKSSPGKRGAKNRPTPKRPSGTPEPAGTGPIQFVKESVAELRKVVYPTSNQLWTYFVVVLVFVLFIIGFTSGVDLGLGRLVLLVFG